MATHPVTAAFTARLPKIELHAHLSGSISRACLHQLWTRRYAGDASPPLADPLVAIPPDKLDYDINTFFPLFSSYIYKLCNDLPAIEYTTKSVLHDFQADGVVYLELRTTPRHIPEHNITKDDYIVTVLDILQQHNQDPSSTMQAFLIASVDRRNTAAEAEQVIDLALKHRDRGLVGVDLCGDPAKGDISIFGPAFARAKAAGLKITLHFAETEHSSSDHELQTLLSWRPDRLGHVIHVKDEFKAAIERADIAVELCLSCNVHARMITGSFPDHHFGWWRRSTVPAILCTDDVGVFCSPLSQEYQLAAQHFNLTRADIKELCERSIGAIFSGSEQQDRLREMYRSWKGWDM